MADVLEILIRVRVPLKSAPDDPNGPGVPTPRTNEISDITDIIEARLDPGLGPKWMIEESEMIEVRVV